MHFTSPLLIVDGHQYTLRADLHRGEWQVRIEDGNFNTVMTIIGTGDDLHGLFLGLHTVLIDAGRAGETAVLAIPGRGTGDEGDLDEDDRGLTNRREWVENNETGYTSGQE